jgi:hypothetical protein
MRVARIAFRHSRADLSLLETRSHLAEYLSEVHVVRQPAFDVTIANPTAKRVSQSVGWY